MRRYHGQIRRAHRWFSLQKNSYCSEFGLGAAGSYPRFQKEVLFILMRAGLAALWSTYLSPPAPILSSGNYQNPCESCRKAVVKGVPPLVSANVSLLLFSSWKLIVWSVATSANRAKCLSSCRPRQGVAIIGTHGTAHSTDRFPASGSLIRHSAAARPPETLPLPLPLPSLPSWLQTGARDGMLPPFC
ncbi:hypothetical protein BDW72DRAFT_74666 [Aspergillus terricola var. indicus]